MTPPMAPSLGLAERAATAPVCVPAALVVGSHADLPTDATPAPRTASHSRLPATSAGHHPCSTPNPRHP